MWSLTTQRDINEIFPVQLTGQNPLLPTNYATFTIPFTYDVTQARPITGLFSFDEFDTVGVLIQSVSGRFYVPESNSLLLLLIGITAVMAKGWHKAVR